MNPMKVTIENKELVVRVPFNESGELSKTGKTFVVASTHGNQKTGLTANGKEIILGLNAYVYANGPAR